MTSTLRMGWILGGLLAALSPTNARAQGEKLTLDEAIALAVKNNERIGLARANVTGADVVVDSTWNAVKPTISASTSPTMQKVIPEFLQERLVSISSARVSQPLFRRGLFSSRDANVHGHAAAKAQLEFECQELGRDVAVAYINVVRARSLQALADNAAQRAVAQYNFAVNRVKAGSALKTVELLAKIDVKRAERQGVSAKLAVGRAEATFLQVVGISPPDLELPTPPEAPNEAAARERAMSRPDLAALRFQIRQAEAETTAARGRRFWPTLDLDASIDYYLPNLEGQTPDPAGGPPIVTKYATDWRVMGVLTIPIFQAGREYTNIALRDNQARIANLQLGLEQRQAVQQVNIGAVEVDTTTQAAALAEEQRDTAREHYSLVDKQFRLGAVTFLDVTNAQAALVEAENAYEVTRIDRLRALYDFLFAAGRLDAGACTGGKRSRLTSGDAAPAPSTQKPKDDMQPAKPPAKPRAEAPDI